MFDRKKHWQDIYQDKSALDVSWYQKEPTLSFALICNTEITRDEPVIDVGGGASGLVDYLDKEGFTNLAVLDISGNALASAKSRLGDSANNITWFEADITQFNPPHQFSLWHDRAVFHFLTAQSDRTRYVSTARHAIRTGGHLIIAAFAIGGPEKCSGLDIVQYNSEKLIAVLGKDFELVEQRDEVHMTPAQKEQPFTYFRFIKVSAAK